LFNEFKKMVSAMHHNQGSREGVFSKWPKWLEWFPNELPYKSADLE
jgi:hypothetical protein